MRFLSSLLAGANVPFTIVLGITVLFALLQLTGVLGLLAGGGDHDGDHDVDADADADADAEADADADADGDADNDADGDQDHDHGGGGGGGRAVLLALGVGKVPLSILWQTFALTFALVGITANALYDTYTGALPTRTLLWTLPLALAAGLGVTRVVGGTLGKVLANPEQMATSRRELVGQTGVVISSKVDGEFGEVRIRDKTGHVVRVICTTDADTAAIPEGREVVVVDYDRDKDRIRVAALDEGEAERRK
jgi:hypothetical protein